MEELIAKYGEARLRRIFAAMAEGGGRAQVRARLGPRAFANADYGALRRLFDSAAEAQLGVRRPPARGRKPATGVVPPVPAPGTQPPRRRIRPAGLADQRRLGAKYGASGALQVYVEARRAGLGQAQAAAQVLEMTGQRIAQRDLPLLNRVQVGLRQALGEAVPATGGRSPVSGLVRPDVVGAQGVRGLLDITTDVAGRPFRFYVSERIKVRGEDGDFRSTEVYYNPKDRRAGETANQAFSRQITEQAKRLRADSDYGSDVDATAAEREALRTRPFIAIERTITTSRGDVI